MADSVLLTILRIFRSLTPDLIDIYTEIYGLEIDVFYPLTEDDFYGTHGTATYSSTPNISGEKYLVLNFLNDKAFMGSATQYEPLYGEGLDDRPFILTYDTRGLPANSEIVVHFDDSKMIFRTEMKKVLTGVSGNLIVRQPLRPMT